jgi:ABC-type sugar transport system ATPase subunit
VGPSGCGKSTLLRIIAGLEDASEGAVIIDDNDVTGNLPSERGLAMVFQSYALYPHMDVGENIGFALKTAGMPTADIKDRVDKVAAILKLESLLDRLPKQLSGGQRQRVAIGRAIVREPVGFLFDEPLSNLDAALRVNMRLEISRLHAQLGITTIYVTHDQIEAMTLADRIVVLNEGRIMQAGSPRELYNNPNSRFVAEFIGSPKMNVLPCTEKAGQIVFAGQEAATSDQKAGTSSAESCHHLLVRLPALASGQRILRCVMRMLARSTAVLRCASIWDLSSLPILTAALTKWSPCASHRMKRCRLAALWGCRLIAKNSTHLMVMALAFDRYRSSLI